MLKTKQQIIKWLDSCSINGYTINKDLSVDVNQSVYLDYKALKEIPVQFNVVKGNFSCSYNQLTSLEGCPKEVQGDFSCYDNKLTSLEGCPQEVQGGFLCYYNKLTSLKGCPREVKGRFDCSINKLTSLKGCPKEIHGGFDCSSNKLTSFTNWPKNHRTFKILKDYIKEKELIKLFKKEPEWLEFI